MKPLTKGTLKQVGEVADGPVARLIIVGLLLVIAGVMLGRIIKAVNSRAYHPEMSTTNFNIV